MAVSSDQRDDAARLREIGFSAYLTKPVKKSHLHDCIRTVLGIATDPSNDSARSMVTRYSVEENKTEKENLIPALRVLLAEDNKTNKLREV